MQKQQGITLSPEANHYTLKSHTQSPNRDTKKRRPDPPKTATSSKKTRFKNDRDRALARTLDDQLGELIQQHTRRFLDVGWERLVKEQQEQDMEVMLEDYSISI